MLVDAFIFFNELDILDLRLAELAPVVDRFILVEATSTFRGDPKPLFFANARQRYAPYLDKITVVSVDLPVNPDPWVRERAQRNAIADELAKCSLDPTDLVILSDADEIPDPDTLRRLKSEGLPPGIHALEQDMYYYNPTVRFTEPWVASKVFTYESLLACGWTMDGVRNSEPRTRIPRGGWHFSYFGGTQAIQTKLNSFSHQELNIPRFTSREHIERCATTATDLFGRWNRYVRIPVSANPYLPQSARTRWASLS